MKRRIKPNSQMWTESEAAQLLRCSTSHVRHLRFTRQLGCWSRPFRPLTSRSRNIRRGSEDHQSSNARNCQGVRRRTRWHAAARAADAGCTDLAKDEQQRLSEL